MGRQYSLLLLLAALCGLAARAFPELGWAWWPLCCGLGLLLCGWLGIEVSPPLSKRAFLAWGLTLGVVLVAANFTDLRSWSRSQSDQWNDRYRLQASRAIYPGKLWEGRPQRLFISGTPPRSASWKGVPTELPVVKLGDKLSYLDIEPVKNAVLELDGAPLDLEQIPSVASPGPLVADPVQGRAACVSESTDQCFVVERDGRVHSFPTEDGPSCCLLLPRAVILVGHRYHPSLHLYSDNGGSLLNLPAPGPIAALALSPSGHSVAALWENASARGVTIYRTQDWKKTAEVPLPGAGEFVVFGHDDSEIVVASRRSRALYRVSAGEGWKLDPRVLNLARPATGLARSNDGKAIYFTSTAPDLVAGDQGGNHFIRESLSILDLKAWSVSHSLPLQDRTARQDSPGDIDSGCGAAGLTVDREGNLLLAFSGSHEVAKIELPYGDSQRTSLEPQQLYCPNSFVELSPGQYLAAFPAQGALAFLKPTLKEKSWTLQATVWLGATDEQVSASDTAAWYRRQGEIGFFESARAGVSCQSCHTKADSDFARHEIGSGSQFGTLSCLGTAGTGPYLRNGGYPSLADLHTTSVDLYRGYRREAPVPRPAALKAYLESLSAPLNPRQLEKSDKEKLRRGFQVFEKAHCAECHAPPAFTSLGLVESKALFPSRGTAESLDVPSLKGVWRSSPFLHDNRAESLEAVIVRENPDNTHGSTRDLTPEEIADLISFLESL